MNSCYRVYAYDVTGNISTHANYITRGGGFCPQLPPPPRPLTRKLNNLKNVQANSPPNLVLTALFWKICIFDLLIYIMYSSNFLSRLAWCIWVKSRMEYIKVIENGGSFHFLLWNKWRYRDITAIVKVYLFVSQRLDFIRHVIIFNAFFGLWENLMKFGFCQ